MGLHARIEEELKRLEDSCFAAARAVAEHMREIASNGNGLETPDAIMAEAEQLAEWATCIADVAREAASEAPTEEAAP